MWVDFIYNLLLCVRVYLLKLNMRRKHLVLSPDNQSNAFVSINIKDNYTGNLLIFQ